MEPLLVVIAPTFAIADTLVRSRQFQGDWRWFLTAQSAIAWLGRCRELGIHFDPTWVDHRPAPSKGKVIAAKKKRTIVFR